MQLFTHLKSIHLMYLLFLCNNCIAFIYEIDIFLFYFLHFYFILFYSLLYRGNSFQHLLALADNVNQFSLGMLVIFLAQYFVSWFYLQVQKFFWSTQLYTPTCLFGCILIDCSHDRKTITCHKSYFIKTRTFTCTVALDNNVPRPINDELASLDSPCHCLNKLVTLHT